MIMMMIIVIVVMIMMMIMRMIIVIVMVNIMRVIRCPVDLFGLCYEYSFASYSYNFLIRIYSDIRSYAFFY